MAAATTTSETLPAGARAFDSRSRPDVVQFGRVKTLDSCSSENLKRKKVLKNFEPAKISETNQQLTLFYKFFDGSSDLESSKVCGSFNGSEASDVRRIRIRWPTDVLTTRMGILMELQPKQRNDKNKVRSSD